MLGLCTQLETLCSILTASCRAVSVLPDVWWLRESTMAEEALVRALCECFVEAMSPSLLPLITLSCGSCVGLPGA